MISAKKLRTVHETGAPVGSVLCGAAPWNPGLRLRVAQAQSKSVGGPIAGPFEILAPGTGKHAGALQSLVGRVSDAAEVLRTIRRHFPQCLNVANANVLVVEGA